MAVKKNAECEIIIKVETGLLLQVKLAIAVVVSVISILL